MTQAQLSPHPRLLVRWFVQYNPMFTASALCVLGGVLLVSRALGAGADVGLTAILELYQWLVIGVAALLYRRLLERRPAAILGVIQLVFMVDPTLQLGALATSSEIAATACWVVMFSLKWRALEWAFGLELSKSTRIVPPVVAALVALVPNARLLGADDTVLPAALAFGVFAVGIVVVYGKLTVTSRQALGEVGTQMFPRLVAAAVAIGVLGALYQCWNALLAIGGHALLPALGAIAFVFAVRAKKAEAAMWMLAMLGFALCAGGDAVVVVGLPLAAVALLVASIGQEPRVFCAGVMTAIATFAVPVLDADIAPMQSPLLVIVGGAATLSLLYVLVRRRAWSAVPALALMHGEWIANVAASGSPQSAGQWGGVLLVAGFVLLPAGVVVHRKLSRVLALDDALAAERAASSTTTGAPLSTSAAVAVPIVPLIE